MHYINPFELLQINAEYIYDIDNSIIRKSKQKLLTEIELNENEAIRFKKIEISKSDCISIVDELDNEQKKEFHFYIFQNQPLNNFLTSGDLTFFTQYKTESIFKEKAFLDFISPYFSVQYNNALIKNYKNNKANNLKTLLSVKPITNESYLDKCYKSTYAFLRDINNDIEKINKDIKDKNSSIIDKNFKGLLQTVSNKVNVPLLNELPSYFQNIRNQLAETINELSTTLNNDPYNSYEVAFQIIELSKSILTDGLAAQKITKDYYIVKKNFNSTLPKPSVTINQINVLKAMTDNAFAELPEPSETINQTSNLKTEEQIQREIKKETKTEKKSYGYWILSCVILAVGFFYSPLQKFILGFSLLILFIPLLAILFIKKTEFSFTNYIKNNILFIVSAALGFYYQLIAQLFISYYFLVYLNTLYDEITKKEGEKKKNLGFYSCLIGAIILTFLYFGISTDLFSGNKKNKEETSKVLTDKDYFEMGKTFFNQQNYTEAINQYNEAIKLNPTFADAFIERGVSKANIRQFEAAISDYIKAEEYGFKKSILFSNLGLAYYNLKQTDNALIYFEKALSIDSSNSNAYWGRGEIKYDKNDNKGAVSDYSLAIKYNPCASNYFARGLAYYYLEDYKKALDDIDNAIELNPNNPQYYYDRGDTKEKNNDISGACSDWKTANEKGYSVPEYKLNMCIPNVIVMENGNIAGCNFQPLYASPANNNYLKIKVGNTDVAVKLINIQTERCIRYVFINQYSTYSITDIPEGKYYMKIAYGEDWAKTTKENNCQGRFTKNTLFKKGDKILDFNLVETNDGWQVPSFELELKVIETENNQNDFNHFNSSNISENDFYNE